MDWRGDSGGRQKGRQAGKTKAVQAEGQTGKAGQSRQSELQAVIGIARGQINNTT